jgi:hypothetical protein
MEIGKLYSCKWKVWAIKDDRGWDMLMFLGIDPIHRSDGVVVTNYRFYDVLTGETRILDRGLIRHCKEITKETACTQ